MSDHTRTLSSPILAMAFLLNNWVLKETIININFQVRYNDNSFRHRRLT